MQFWEISAWFWPASRVSGCPLRGSYLSKRIQSQADSVATLLTLTQAADSVATLLTQTQADDSVAPVLSSLIQSLPNPNKGESGSLKATLDPSHSAGEDTHRTEDPFRGQAGQADGFSRYAPPDILIQFRFQSSGRSHYKAAGSISAKSRT